MVVATFQIQIWGLLSHQLGPVPSGTGIVHSPSLLSYYQKMPQPQPDLYPAAAAAALVSLSENHGTPDIYLQVSCDD